MATRHLRRDTRAPRLSRRTAIFLAGTLTIVGASAPLAGASTKQASTTTTANQYKALEKKLSQLEKPTSTSLLETGSTLFYPLLSAWAPAHPLGISLTTQGTGSGTGIADAEKGTVDIGASDAYLPPSAPSNMLNIPVVVSAQQIDYHLPGISKNVHLRLDAAVLNGMYTGAITSWNAPQIQTLNKGVKLPSTPVIPLHRSDGSGDSFLFSSYLSYQDPSSFVNSSGGPSTSPTFPNVSSALAALGNQGMLNTCEQTVGCVAYIGVSFLREALAAGIGDAQLFNGTGHYVLPTPVNIANEVASYKHIPTNGTISLVNSKSAKFGYPIANFEYAIVQKGSAKAAAIQALLAWGMDPRHGGTTQYLAPVYFQGLAPNAMSVAINLLKQV